MRFNRYTSSLLYRTSARIPRRTPIMSSSTYVSLSVVILLATAIPIIRGAPTHLPTQVTPTIDASLVVTLQLYRAVTQEMDELRLVQKTAYDEYKLDRFSDADVRVPPMELEGIPDLSGMTNADRFTMNESAILQLHRSSLISYSQLMISVAIDESQSQSPKDFGPQFDTISARLVRVKAGIQALMNHQDSYPDGLPTQPFVGMAPENNASMRIIRDLYVLQEMYSYLAIAEYDLNDRYLRHVLQARASL